MWLRYDEFNRMKMDRMLKIKIPVGIHRANGYARVCFFSQGEEACMKMILHLADAVENDNLFS